MELASNNMYRLRQEAHITQQELVDWHERYGHIPLSVFRKIKEAPEGIYKHSLQCDACIRGKLAQPPSPKHQDPIRTTRVGQLVHVDICGPVGVQSRKQEKFILSLIDDYSRMSMAEPLKERKDAVTKLPEMIARFESRFNCKIGEVRRDYGKELEKATQYANKAVRATVAYHHETNPVAER